MTSLLRDAAGLALQDLALENPDLDADDSVGSASLGEPEIHIGAQRVQRHSTLAIGLDPTHLCAAEPPGTADARALGPELHGGRQRLLHRPPECNPALELSRDVLGHELRVGLGLAHFLHVDEHLVARERLNARKPGFALAGGVEIATLERLYAFAALANHHAGTRRIHD